MGSAALEVGLRERFVLVLARGGGGGQDGGPGCFASPMRLPRFQSWVRSLVAHCGARVAGKVLLVALSALFFLRRVRVLRCHGVVEVRAEEGHNLLYSVCNVPQVFSAGGQE